MISNADENELSRADSPIALDHEEQSKQPLGNALNPIAFVEDQESTLVGQMETESENGSGSPAAEQVSAIVAESAETKLSEIPKQFDESFFLSAKYPPEVLKAHASSMTEGEVRTFVDDVARAADKHGKKLADIIVVAAPFILREREFYNQQGKRNVQGKTWTDRKQELAKTFSAGVRTLERELTKMLKTETMEYKLDIPGLIKEMPITFDKDRLPEIKNLVARCQLLPAAPESSDAVVADSPKSLWKIIDTTLKDAIENVFFVDDPREFAARLKELAQEVANSFFPETMIDVKPAPAKDETI